MANGESHCGVLLDEQNRHSLFVDLSVASLFHTGLSITFPEFRKRGNVGISVVVLVPGGLLW